MPFDPERHHRRSVRIPGYDYGAPGSYFVTICTLDRRCLFGDVVDDQMRVNRIGRLVEDAWMRTGELRPDVEIDVFALMPNHLHGIVSILPTLHASVTAEERPAPQSRHPHDPPRRQTRSLSSILAQFKATSTAAVNAELGTPGAKLWQRGFHEHVIRDERALSSIAEYIVSNPSRWHTDEYAPSPP